MNHLAALLNVLSDIDIPNKLSHEIFESYLGQYFQLIGENNNMEVSDQDFGHMQEVAFALGISEKEFEKIMTEEEEEKKEEETKEEPKTKKKAKEEDEELPDAHDDIYEKPEEKADETDMTNHINRWFGGGKDNRNNTNFLF